MIGASLLAENLFTDEENVECLIYDQNLLIDFELLIKPKWQHLYFSVTMEELCQERWFLSAFREKETAHNAYYSN